MRGPRAGLPFKLIVGLGNPGAEYARTRHNAGLWFVDALADAASAAAGGAMREQHAELARVRIGGSELWLLKPTTS